MIAFARAGGKTDELPGEILRVGPNELHFSNPQAYHDIYNKKNRWDKDATLYHNFNEDQSSFGFLTSREAKERKDVLNRMFSPKAVTQAKGLVIDKVLELEKPEIEECVWLGREDAPGQACLDVPPAFVQISTSQ